MSEAPLATTTAIEEFRKAFNDGICNIVKASEIYVRAIDETPLNADRFRDEFADSIPASAWSGFEAVGRKWMHPKLLMGGMANRKKSTIVKKLPYSTQERIFNRERFSLLVSDGETLEVDVLEATPEQAEQLFNGSETRSIAAQKAWLEAKRVAESVEEPPPLPYTINGGKISFRRGVTLTRSDMKRLLVEM